MFDQLGWGELTVILLLALFVFGPERLPGLAQDAGRALRQVRDYLKGSPTTSRPSSGRRSATSTSRRCTPRPS